jgi:hypothetical protein
MNALSRVALCVTLLFSNNVLANANNVRAGENFIENNFQKMNISENDMTTLRKVKNINIKWGGETNTLSQKQNIDIETLSGIKIENIDIKSVVLDIENTANKIEIFNSFGEGNAIQELTDIGQIVSQEPDRYKNYESQFATQIKETNSIKEKVSIKEIAHDNWKNLRNSIDTGFTIAKAAGKNIPIIKTADLLLDAKGKVENIGFLYTVGNEFNKITSNLKGGKDITTEQLTNLLGSVKKLFSMSDSQKKSIGLVGGKVQKVGQIITILESINNQRGNGQIQVLETILNSNSSSNSSGIVKTALQYKKSKLHRDYLLLSTSILELFDYTDSVGDLTDVINEVDNLFRDGTQRSREAWIKSKKEKTDRVNVAIDGLLLTAKNLTNEVYEDIGTEVENNPERLNIIISNRYQIPIVPPIDQDNNVNKEIGDNEDREEVIENANSPNIPLDNQYSYITTSGDYGYNSVETVNSYSVKNGDTLTDVIGSGAVQLKLNVQTATGDKVLDTITTTPTTNDGTRQFQYVGWGEYIGTGKTFVAPWDSQTKTVQHGYYTIGVPTNHYPDGGSYPKSATYNGSIQGDYANNTSGNIAGAVSGTITFNADFTNNSIGGQMNVNVNNTPWETTTFNNINFSQQDNSFNGSMTIIGGGTGQIAGGFNGQNAEESAGGFFINKNNGEGVSGIYRAKR